MISLSLSLLSVVDKVYARVLIKRIREVTRVIYDEEKRERMHRLVVCYETDV